MRIVARLIHLAGDARLERLFSRPELERVLFGALARRFDPRVAPGFHGHVVYELQRPATAGQPASSAAFTNASAREFCSRGTVRISHFTPFSARRTSSYSGSSPAFLTR